MTHALLIVLVLLFAPFRAANGEPAASDTLRVSTPLYPNAACPIMGKAVSTKLFADTEMGRIFVCCKSCIRDILADVPAAYRTAYPSEQKLENKLCPVSGKEITKDSPRVVLQGYSFSVHAAADVAPARENSQIVLAKLLDPKLVDLANGTCPVNGQPVAKNAFVVIDGTLVRLSSAKLLDEVSKKPAAVLKQARAIREREAKS